MHCIMYFIDKRSYSHFLSHVSLYPRKSIHERSLLSLHLKLNEDVYEYLIPFIFDIIYSCELNL